MSLKKYAIWDKESQIITPIGEILSPEQWVERYPIAGVDGIKIVCGAPPITGSFFGILDQMIQMYELDGADFSEAETDEEKLEVIEAFEELRNNLSKNGESTPEERIAAALEYNNLLNTPAINLDDPDED